MNKGFFSIFFDETGTISGSKDKNPYGGGFFGVEDEYLDDCRSFMEELRSDESGNIHLSKIQSKDKKLRICKKVSEFLRDKNCFLTGYIESNSNLEFQLSFKQNIDIKHYKTFRMQIMYSSFFSDALCSGVILNNRKGFNHVNVKLIIESLEKKLNPNEEKNIIQDFEDGAKLIRRLTGINLDWNPKELVYKKKQEEILLSIADLAAYASNAIFRGDFSYYQELKLIFIKSGFNLEEIYNSVIRVTEVYSKMAEFYENLRMLFRQSEMNFKDIHGITIAHTLSKDLEKYAKLSQEKFEEDILL